jgi:hypothetical protein
MVGLDRSQNLLNIARTAGSNGTIREVVRGDVLERGWRRGAFVRIHDPSARHKLTHSIYTLRTMRFQLQRYTIWRRSNVV